MNNQLIYIIIGFSPFVGLSQTVNEGILCISSDTEISTMETFVNEKDASLSNDGTIYYYSDFRNEGLYTFDAKLRSSYAIFQPQLGNNQTQLLSGSSPSQFYDVLFNNPKPIAAFDLKNDMSVAGTVDFKHGIVQVDSLMGIMVFEQGSKAINVSDLSHVDGFVEKKGKDSFVFPIGDQEIYRQARISAPPKLKDSFLAKYYFKNSDKQQPHSSKTAVINHIDNQEYWSIDHNHAESTVILTLTWDESKTPSVLLRDEAKNLRVLRWDSNQKLWVDEGGIVDFEAKTVTTPTVVKGFGIFTLGTIMEDLILEGDVVIYNAVSPNGDGVNDYFIIDNMERFPNNTVEIYNRWGVKVYETQNYNSTGNVFKGISEGRVTVGSNPLPSGTYYYIINYEHTDKNGSKMIKKSGYLHLENN